MGGAGSAVLEALQKQRHARCRCCSWGCPTVSSIRAIRRCSWPACGLDAGGDCGSRSARGSRVAILIGAYRTHHDPDARRKRDGRLRQDRPVQPGERSSASPSKYRDILRDIGEDPDREGLVKTPERVAKALQFLTHGYDLDPAEILRSAMFTEEYQQMVIVKRHRGLFAVRAPHAAVFRQGARRLHPQRAASSACRKSRGWWMRSPAGCRCRSA